MDAFLAELGIQHPASGSPLHGHPPHLLRLQHPTWGTTAPNHSHREDTWLAYLTAFGLIVHEGKEGKEEEGRETGRGRGRVRAILIYFHYGEYENNLD